jgi:protein CpxP
MNYFDKPKIMGILILLLLVLNFGTLAFMWFNKPFHPPGMEMRRDGPPPPGNEGERPGEFLIHELNLSQNQLADFIKLRDEHQNAIKQVLEDTKKNKDDLFKMLSAPQVDSVKLNQLTDNIAKDQKQLELATFNHFQKVRVMCDDNQKKKFDEIIGDVLKMMAGPPPGPKGPPPGPPR